MLSEYASRHTEVPLWKGKDNGKKQRNQKVVNLMENSVFFLLVKVKLF
jgi:hypothetical protein